MTKTRLRTPHEIEKRLRQNLQRRKLPDCFLYVGDSGAQNWLDLEQSADFTVASRLTELLSENVETIAGALPEPCDLVSIGVGDGQKERILLESLLPEWNGCYVPVDVSSELVDAALETVSNLDVEAKGIVAFFQDLRDLTKYWSSPACLCLLGNNFCNYHPEELLGTVSSEMRHDDLFLFDAHLRPDTSSSEQAWRRRVENAYGSEKNARFNVWPLIEHGMAPEACRFDIGLVQTQTAAGLTYRTQKEVLVLEPSILVFEDGEVELSAGEMIEMGFTYKYTLNQLHDLIAARKWRIVHEFCDEDRENALFLVEIR